MAAKRLKLTIFLLLLFHLLVVAAMAANPAFHEWLHHDSDHEDHECAVTLFLSGNVHASVAPVIVIERVSIFERELAAEEFFDPVLPLLRSGILEHAPPVGISA